jgi:hypothetical protein
MLDLQANFRNTIHSLGGDSLKIKCFQRLEFYSSQTNPFLIQKHLRNLAMSLNCNYGHMWHSPMIIWPMGAEDLLIRGWMMMDC